MFDHLGAMLFTLLSSLLTTQSINISVNINFLTYKTTLYRCENNINFLTYKTTLYRCENNINFLTNKTTLHRCENNVLDFYIIISDYYRGIYLIIYFSNSIDGLHYKFIKTCTPSKMGRGKAYLMG